MTSLLHDLLTTAAQQCADREALTDLSGARRSFTFAELLSMSSSCAARLQKHGIRRRDRVAIYLPKCAEEATAFFAVSMAGGVFVSVNSLLLEEQVGYILDDCDARYLITSTADWSRISRVGNLAPSLEMVFFVDDAPQNFSCSIPFVSSVFSPTSSALLASTALPQDLCGILYTSGSTGKPRGVMLSHNNLVAGARIVSTYLNLKDNDRILSVVPFSFDYGLNQLLTAVLQRASIVLMRFRFPSEIVRAIRDEKATGFAGVPLIWAGLIHNMSGLSKTPLPTLRYITNTGGRVPVPTVHRLRELLPKTDIFLMYGLTEAFRSTYLPPSEVDRRPDSIGKAIPETEIFVINDKGEPCKPFEPGTLVHRGPTVSLGYWRKPELTQKVLKPHPFIPEDEGGDIVCYSGDLVRTDEEGFIYFIGRRDGQIKSQGYRISPTEVEEALMATGEFSQAAVIGLPDAEAGERVHAIVVPANGNSVHSDRVLQKCAERLPSYMVPKAIEVVEVLPQTPNGKVDYPTLRKQRIEVMA